MIRIAVEDWYTICDGMVLRKRSHRMPTTRIFRGLGALVCTGLISASLWTAQAQAQGTKPIRYATGTDAQTLDPQFVTDIPTARVVTQIHETLVYPNSAGEMVGVLAE